MERVRPPFNVSRAVQVAALAALDDQEHVERAVEVNRIGVAQVLAGLEDLPADPTPSRGNFLLVDVRCLSQPIFEAMLRRGVITRPMAGYGLPQCLRISIGTEAENALMLEALGASLAERVGVAR
jgi:histidinol-phosphate aminotransferase